MLPIEVGLHSVRVGLAGANAGRDSFEPVAVRLQNGHRLSGPPAVRESSETATGSTHAEPCRPRLQPSETPKSDEAQKRKKNFTKNVRCNHGELMQQTLQPSR